MALSQLRNKKQDADFLKENIPNNMVSLIIDEEISNDKITLLNAKLQNLSPRFFRVDYKSINTDLIENSSTIDYNLIDIEKNIEDFVNSIDVQHKEDVIKYLTTTYKELAL